jgi:DnaJ-class molecular chaperone
VIHRARAYWEGLRARAATEVHARGRLCCRRCHGYGVFHWGTEIGGIPEHRGTCSRCDGSGIDPRSRRSAVGTVAYEKQALRFRGVRT